MGSTQGNIVVTHFNGERVERNLMPPPPPLLFIEAPLQSVVLVLMGLIQCCGWSKGLELPRMLKCCLGDLVTLLTAGLVELEGLLNVLMHNTTLNDPLRGERPLWAVRPIAGTFTDAYK